MNVLLQSLLGLTGITEDQANDIWRNLCYIVVGLLCACISVFALNTLFGWHWPALVLAMVFVPAAAFAWARPLFFLCIGIAGLAEKLASNATLAESLKDVFRAYSGVFKWTTVVVVIYCFVMFFFSLNENSSMAVTALFALVVVGVCLWAWPELFPGALARKTVYWGSVAVVICGLLSQIPAPYWIKYVGWAPSFAPTVAENMISDIRKAQAANKEKADGKSLEEIREKAIKGGTLTTAEESLVTKKEAEAKTAKALAGATVDKLSDAGPSPSLATVWETTKKNLVWILLLCAVIYGVGKIVGGRWATAGGLIAGFVLGLCFVVAPIGAQIDGSSGPQKQAEKATPTLTMPANGYSDHVLPPVGYFTRFVGHGYVIRCVYSDGTEGIVGDQSRPCRDGPMLYQYLHNTTDKVNIVSYSFIR